MTPDTPNPPDRPHRRAADRVAENGDEGIRSEYRQLLYDQRRSNAAFSRFVPSELLSLLGAKSILEASLGNHADKNLTAMFCDLRDFTALTEDMPPREVLRLINRYIGHMEPAVQSHHGIIDKFIGDSVLALFPRGPDDALRAAIAMQQAMDRFNQERAAAGGKPLFMSIGINSGFVTLGIIGHVERLEATVLGDAINVASRIESAAKRLRLRIVASDSVIAGLQDQNAYSVRFVDRIRLKGRRHPNSLYEVFDCDPPALAKAKLRGMEKFERAVALYHMKMPAKAYPLVLDCLEKAPLDVVAQYYARRCEAFEEHQAYEGTDELSAQRQWEPAYDTGIHLIDRQHRTLFDNIIKLSVAITADDAAAVDEVFAFIEEYARQHFADEEALMASHDYPLLQEHRNEHRAFGRAFAQRRGEILSGRHDKLHAVFMIDLFLTDWLINHSTKTDRHFAKYLLDKAGADPTAVA